MVFQRDACVSWSGVGIEKRFKQDELLGHLGCEAAVANSKPAPPLTGTHGRLDSLGQEWRFNVSSKGKNEAVEG